MAVGGINIDGTTNKISGLADGDVSATSTDAVNGSQLFATNQNVAQNTADIATNTANIATNTANIAKGIKFGDGSTSNQYALGDTLNVVGDSNVTSTTTATGVQLGLAPVLNVGTANPVTIDGNAGTVGGLTNTTFDPANITTGQAATEDQLAQVNATALASKTTVVEGDNIDVTEVVNADGSREYTIATAKDVTFDSVAVGGINIDGTTNKISGLADGDVSATSTDAVNGSQLYDTHQAIANMGDQFHNRIGDVEQKAHAGIASAMAMENAPYVPGKYTYAAGVAYSGGESAVGLTLRKTADNGRWSLTGGVAVATEGDPSVRLGISGIIK